MSENEKETTEKKVICVIKTYEKKSHKKRKQNNSPLKFKPFDIEVIQKLKLKLKK